MTLLPNYIPLLTAIEENILGVMDKILEWPILGDKGTNINDGVGVGENCKKKFQRPFSRKKNLKGHPAGKKVI